MRWTWSSRAAARTYQAFLREHARVPVVYAAWATTTSTWTPPPTSTWPRDRVNAKVQRPGVCNAAESLLVHRDVAPAFPPRAAERRGRRGRPAR